MVASEALKDLKSVWGDSCHSMWVELLCVSISEATIFSSYPVIDKKRALSDFFYAPALSSRLKNFTKDEFLGRTHLYRTSIITNRVVIISASFELYFSRFLDLYIENRSKYFDQKSRVRTQRGDKLYGDVSKVRGLVSRVNQFSDLTGSGIKTINDSLGSLDEIYTLRNVLAHRAGIIDDAAAKKLKKLSFKIGDKIVLTPDELISLVAPVIVVAEFLDRKIVSEYDNSIGRHPHKQRAPAQAVYLRPKGKKS
ncbi:hypothetical protein ACFQI3_14215 [Hansschlegelia quercus]|uniref:RiboL-PSP-HEPN domain-containing protein n=1 Tax=Hansschlegelia quercus TaxID=2528245 RepID=A0A4Q9GIG6_9HYPH|nr:hypothetical protein [Hansschlegelia quercus]TBN48645.1 hypothetical protein EYR15_13740 [Hansschlegelia quercus]